MVDSDKAIDTEEQQKYEAHRVLKRKIMTATEQSLLKLMNEGKGRLIAEFKYRRPELRAWVEQLEIAYWDDHDQRMSQWK